MKDKTSYKTDWNLSVFYKDENDPRIEEELQMVEKACDEFEKKYRGKDFTKNSTDLLEALKYLEEFNKKLAKSKSDRYFYFRKDLNSKDSVASAFATKINNRMTPALNKTIFFDLEITKISKEKQKEYLKDEKLKPFRYFLKTEFDKAKHVLSEKEEQIVGLTSETSFSMWVDGQEKLLNSQMIKWKGESIPISKAASMIDSLPKKDRKELHDNINEVLKSISHFAEAEINAIYNWKKVMDERRGFEKPYSNTILNYENDEKNIEMLVSLITENFSICQRFYKLHAKLLKEKKLSVADRNAKIGEVKKKFTFPDSVSIVGETFGKVGKRYKDLFEMIVSNSQVDVYPKEGKTGGAYCAGGYDVPTFVLLNHVDNLRSLETLAHEMGHAMHTELSKSQPIFYQGYSTATAEVASTFFEQVVLSEIENLLSKEEKIILLHTKLVGEMATVFRQIACFNFELELHQRIRKEGQLPKEEIAKLLSKHLKSYLGEAFEVTETDGYFFVNWSHIRNFFYVYSYAYGQIISRALFENLQKDKSYGEKIEKFLSAGGSMSPEDIFKSVGIDTSKKEFFEAGLKSIEKDIEKLEKLTSKA
jgi:oligoendopeptidase F